MINTQQDGLDQLSKIFSGSSSLDAVHIISHGDAGKIHIGDGVFDHAALRAQAQAVGAWSASLSENADLLIYGCNLVSTAEGEQFLDTLAQLTGADVAASDDLTGSATCGGDWALEYRSGTIESVLAFKDEPQHTHHQFQQRSAVRRSGAVR